MMDKRDPDDTTGKGIVFNLVQTADTKIRVLLP